MGNAEGRPVQHRNVEVPQITSRPLPPLPKETEEGAEEDEYDLDTPPPYPPPPPPHDENGVKSKRISWRFKDTNIFGGMKRGSWALNTQAENELYKSNDERSRNSQNVSGKNLSNTIALEDNNVVTVSVIGTPENNSQAFINNKYSSEGSQSWGVKNMQLIMNNEMKGGDINSSKNVNNIDSPSIRPSISANRNSNHVETYPYPDVQNIPDHEGSMLPDLVSVRGQSKFSDNIKIRASAEPPSSINSHEYDQSNLPYALRTERIGISTNADHQDVLRVEDIRLDYPEGKVKEISNYSRFDYDAECKGDDISFDTNTESDFNMGEIKLNEALEITHDNQDKKLDLDKTNLANDSATKSAKPKLKLGSCFGKPKTVEDVSCKDSKEPVDTSTHKIDNESDKTKKSPILKPKKEGKKGLPSCFGDKKDSSKDNPSDEYKKDSSKDNASDEYKETDTTIDHHINAPKSELDIECSPEVRVKGEIEGKKNKKNKFSSYFGLKNSAHDNNDIDTELHTDVKNNTKIGNDFELSCNTKGSLNISNESEDENDARNAAKLDFDPKFDIKANVDSPTLFNDDFNLDIKRIKPEFSEFDLEMEQAYKDINLDLEMKHDIDTPDITVKSPDYDIKVVKFDLPKIDANVEGKGIDFDVSPDFGMDLQGPNVDTDLNLSFNKAFDLPDDTFEGESVKIKTPAVNVDLEGRLPQIPELEHDIDFKTQESNIKSVVTVPKIPRVEADIEFKSPEVLSPDIKASASGELPKISNLKLHGDVEGETPEIKVSKVKGKKIKGGPCSCAGKPKGQVPKGEVYMPSNSLDEEVSPKLEVDIKGKIPTIEGEVDIKPDVEIGKGKLKAEKPKSNLGSCFGKAKTPKVEAPTIKGDIDLPGTESSLDLKAPTMEIEVEGDLDVKSPKIAASPPVSSGKGKLGLGSCFGKKQSPSPNDKVERSLDIEVASPSIPEAKAELDIPQVTARIDVPEFGTENKITEPKSKKSSKLGSCFGKSKSPNLKTEIPSVETSVSAVAKESDSEGIGGEIKVEPPKISVNSKEPSGKGKLNLGSCFGKKAHKDVKIEEPLEISLAGPSVKADIRTPECKGDIALSGPEINTEEKMGKKEKGKGLSSCFGKRKHADVDVSVPSGKVEGSLEPVPELEAANIEVGIEGETPEVSLSLDPKIKAPQAKGSLSLKSPKPKKSTAGLGSCFGKKPKTDAAVKSDIDPSLATSLPTGDLKGKNTDTDIEHKSKKVKGGLFASCVGKKPRAEIDLQTESNLPKVEVASDLPSTDIAMTVDPNIGVTIPELSSEADLKFDADIESPKIAIEKPDYDLNILKMDMPKVDLIVEGNAIDIIPDLNIDTEGLKLDHDASLSLKCPDMPEGSVKFEEEVKINAPNFDIDLGNMLLETQEFDKHFELNTNLPDVENVIKVPEIPIIESDITVEIPEVLSPELKLSTSEDLPEIPRLELQGDIKGTTPDFEVPKVKGKKFKGGPCSCLSKPKGQIPKGDAYMPSGTLEGGDQLESPKLSGEIKSEVPSVAGKFVEPEVEITQAELKGKKPKSKLGSCFGSKTPKVTPPTTKADSDIPAVVGSATIDAPQIGIDVKEDVDIKAPELKASKSSTKGKLALGSCFGKKKSPPFNDKVEESVDISVAGPSVPAANVEVAVPHSELGVNIPENEVEGKISGSKAEVKGRKPSKLSSCFGKRKTPEFKTDSLSGEVKLKDSHEGKVPEVEIKGNIDIEATETSVKYKEPSGKGKLNLGSCFGKQKPTDISKREVTLTEPSGEAQMQTPKIEGDVEIVAPTLKIDSDIENDKQKKGKGFGSCFGKRKSGDVKLEGPSGKIEGALDGDSDTNSPKMDVDISGHIQDVSLSAPIKLKEPAATSSVAMKPQKQGKVGLGSCFKKKSKPDVALNDTYGEQSSPKSEELSADFKIKPKKVKGGLWTACVGKKPRANIDLDVETKTPDVKLSGDLPETDINKKVETNLDLKLPELPSVDDINVAAEINSPSIEVEKPDYDLQGLKLDFPKVDLSVENRSPDFDIFHDASIDIKGPTIDSDANLSLKSPDEPKFSIDLGEVKVDAPDLNLELEGKLPEMSEFERDIDLKIQLPDIEESMSVPTIPKCEADLILESPELLSTDIEVSACAKLPEVPKLELETDIKGKTCEITTPKVKGKKIKGGPCACIAKPKGKDSKGEAYMPSGTTDIKGEIKSPKVQGKIAADIPALEVDASIKSDMDIPKSNLKAEKSKSKLGSCFGKSKTPKVKVPSVEGGTNVQAIEASADIKAPEVGMEVSRDVDITAPELEASVSQPMTKKEFDLGSCFGKKKKQLDSDKVSGTVDVSVAGPSAPETTVEVCLPQVKADIEAGTEISGPKTKVKGKKSNKFSSCFGNRKTPSLDAEASIKGSAEGKTPEIEVGGNIDVESPDLEAKYKDLDIKSPEIEASVSKPSGKGKFDLGSCFGKKKAPLVSDKVGGVVEVPVAGPSIPDSEIEVEIKQGKADVGIPECKAEVKISGPKANLKEKKPSKFGSCFGKNKTSKLETQIPSVERKIPEVEVGGNIEAKSPELEVKYENVDIKSPEIEASVSKPSGKGKFDLGSCFGKKKAPLEHDNVGGAVDISVAGPSIPESEIEVGLPQVKADVCIPECKAEVEISDPKAKLKEKKPSKFGSCFGKSKTSKLDTQIPSVDIYEGKTPEVEVGGNIDVESLDLEATYKDVDIKSPEIKASVSKPSDKGKFDLGSCFGKKKAPLVKDKVGGAVTVSVAGPSVPESEIEVGLPQVKADVGIPEYKAEVEISGSKANLKEKKPSKFGSCFGKRKTSKLDTQIPSVEVEASTKGSLEGKTPEVEFGGQINGDSPELESKYKNVDIKDAEIEASVSQPTSKGKFEFGSCFGKKKAPLVSDEVGGTVDISVSGPSIPESEIKVEIPQGKADVSFPECKADVSISGPKANLKEKKPSKFGSCFGKRKTSKLDTKIPSVEVEASTKGSLEGKIPEVEVGGQINVDSPELESKYENVDIKSPELEASITQPTGKGKFDFGSCFGKKKEHLSSDKVEGAVDISLAGPSIPESKVQVELPKVTADVDNPKYEAGVEISEPKANVKTKKPSKFGSCFGKSKSTKLETKIPSGEVEASVSVSSERKISEVDIGATVDVEAPKLDGKSEQISSKGKLGLGSCFGKKKRSEIDKGAVEINIAGPSQVEIDAPKVGDSVEVCSPNIKVEGGVKSGKIKKRNLSSCFGKNKSGDIDADIPSAKIEGSLVMDPELLKPKVDVGIEGKSPEASLSVDPKLKLPEAEGSLSLKSPKTKKTKSGLGSCFGKGPKADVNMRSDVDSSVEVALPKGNIKTGGEIDVKPKSKKIKGGLCASCVGKKPKKALNLDVEGKSPKKSLSSELSSDINMKLNPSLDVTVPELATVPDFEVEAEINSPKINIEKPDYELEDVKVDLPIVDLHFESTVPDVDLSPDLDLDVMGPKIDIDLGKDGGIDIPDISKDLEGRVPQMSEFEERTDFKANLPDIEGNITGPTYPKCEADIKLESPELLSPDIQVFTSGELPKVPKLELKGDIKGTNPKIEVKKVKGARLKGDPCSCIGNNKGQVPKSEIYMPSGTLESRDEMESPKGSVEIKADLPSLEGEVSAKSDVNMPKGNLKLEKPKSKLGSCFGKSKTPKPKALSAEGDIHGPKIEVSTDIAASKGGMEVKGDLKTPELEATAPQPTSKGKLRLGSCFGKKKSPLVSDKVEGSTDISVAGPSASESTFEAGLPNVQGELDIPECKLGAKISEPKVKVKDKKSVKFGSCFGKSKTPELSAEISSGVEKSSIEGSSKLEIGEKSNFEAPEVKGTPKEISGQGKLGLGSCFGKKKPIEVEKKGSAELDLAGTSKAVPKLKGGVEVSTPELKVGEAEPGRIKKEKTFGSCFGKRNSRDIEVESPSTKIEASLEVDPNISKTEIDVDFKGKDSKDLQLKSPEVESSLSLKSPKPKKTKAGLGSCFGKKPKADANLVVTVPELPSSPNLEVEGEISLPKTNVEKPDYVLKGAEFDIPKVDGNLEGTFNDVDNSSDLILDIKVPHTDIDFRNGAEIANSELEYDFDGKLPIMPEFSQDAKLPDIEYYMPVQSETEIVIESPQMLDPGINMSASGELPKIPILELKSGNKEEIPEIAVSKVKGKKVKGGACSCIGKPTGQVPKSDVYMPPEHLESSAVIKTPHMESEIKGQIPSLEGDASLKSDVEFPKRKIEAKKPKAKLGSCFGKKKAPTVEEPSAKVNINIEDIDTSTNIEAPKVGMEIKGDIGPESPEIDTSASKNSGKGKFGLGSCFGKNKPTPISGKVGESVDISVAGPSSAEATLEVGKTLQGEPQVEYEVGAGISGPKSKVKNQNSTKFGSCFGKSKTSKLKTQIPSGEVKTSVTSSHKIEVPDVEVEGKIHLEPSEVEVKPKEIPAKEKLNLGSCFGKKKPVNGKGSTDISVVKPSGEVHLHSPEFECEVKDSDSELKVKDVKLSKNKKQSNLGSCFGKSKSQDINIEGPSVKLEGSHEVDPKLKTPALDASFEKEAPDVSLILDPKLKTPEGEVSLSVKSSKSEKAKIGFGSCFGKNPKPNVTTKGFVDPHIEVDLNMEAKPKEIKLVHDLPSTDINVRVDSTLDNTVPALASGTDLKLDTDINYPTIAVKNADYDLPNVELNLPKVDLNLEGRNSEIDISPTLSSEVKCPSIDYKLNSSFENPNLSTGIVGESVNIKTSNLDLDLEGKLPEIPELAQDISFKTKLPNIEGVIEIPEGPSVTADYSLESPEVLSPEIKVCASGDLPDIPKLKLEEGFKGENPEVNVPKIKGKKIKGGPCSCAGKPKGHVPKGEVYMPSKDFRGEEELGSPMIKGQIKGELPTVQGEVDLKSEAKINKDKLKIEKPKSKLGSCFGKTKIPKSDISTSKGDIDVTGTYGSADIEAPTAGIDVKGSVDIETPGIEGSATGPSTKDKGKLGLGSCFGKKNSPSASDEVGRTINVGVTGPYVSEAKVEVDVPQVKAGVDVPNYGIETDIMCPTPEVKVKKPSKFGSCFGKGKTPVIEAEIPSDEIITSVTVDSEEIDPKVKIGDNIDAKTPKIAVNSKEPSGKGTLNLGSCFGKKNSYDTKKKEPKEVTLSVPSVTADMQRPSCEGDINITAPEVKVGDVNGDKKIKVKGLSSLFGKRKSCDIDVEETSGEIKGSIELDPEIKKQKLDIDIEGDTSLKPKAKSKNVKGGLFSSCVGKKPQADVNLDFEAEPSKVVMSCDLPSTDINVKVDHNVDLNTPEFSSEVDINLDAESNFSNMAVTKPEYEFQGMQYDFPKVELNLDGKEIGTNISSKLDVDMKSPNINDNFDIPFPNLHSQESSIKVEGDVKIETPIVDLKEPQLLSEFDNDINLKLKRPDIEVGILVPDMPRVEVDINTPDKNIQMTAPAGLSKLPKLDLETNIKGKAPKTEVTPAKEKKIRGGPCSCVGVPISSEGETYMPAKDSDIGAEVKPSKVKSEIQEVPFVGGEGGANPDLNISKGKLEAEKPNSKFGSCFGKTKTPKFNIPAIEGNTDAPIPECSVYNEDPSFVIEAKGDVDGKPNDLEKSLSLPSSKGKLGIGSIFGKKKTPPVNDKIDGSSDFVVLCPSISKTLDKLEVEDVSSGLHISHPNIDVENHLSGNVNLNVEHSLSKESDEKQFVPYSSNYDNNIENDTPEIATSTDSLPYELRLCALPSKDLHQISDLVPDVNNISASADFKADISGDAQGIQKAEFPAYSGHDKSVNIQYPDSFFTCNIPNLNESIGLNLEKNIDHSTQDGIKEQQSHTAEQNIYDIDNLKAVDEIFNQFQGFQFNLNSEALDVLKTSYPIKDRSLEINSNIDVAANTLPYKLRMKPDLEDSCDGLEGNISFDVNAPSSDSIVLPNVQARSEFETAINPVDIEYNSTCLTPEVEGEFDLSDQSFKPPELPKRWFGLDSKKMEVETQEDQQYPSAISFSETSKWLPVNDSDSAFFSMGVQTGSPHSDDISLIANSGESTIPSEAISGFQSIQFVKKMVQDDIDDKPYSEPTTPVVLESSNLPTTKQDFRIDSADNIPSNLNLKKVESKPTVKKTVKIKTYKTGHDLDEPEEFIEEHHDTDFEKSDASKLLMRKLADFDYEGFSSQPVIKRTIKVKTYKTMKDGDEPEETVEEYEDGADDADIDRSEATKLLLRKLVDMDCEEGSSQPIIKRTVKVKTYKTTEGSDEPEEIIEEYEEGAQDINLNKSEATKLLLKKLADFDGQGISSQPIVKRTVKVKTYKTKEGSDEPEEIEEFEQTSDDMSISEFLHKKYPELGTHSQIFDYCKPNVNIETSEGSAISEAVELEGNTLPSDEFTRQKK